MNHSYSSWLRHGARRGLLLLALGGLASTAFGQSFGAKTDYTAGSSPYDVAVGDINGDGRSDIVTANYGGSGVSVLLGLAAGGFGAKTDYPTGAGPLSVALGDVNGDGRLDIATANLGGYNGTTVSVLLGLAGGGFGAKTDYTTGLAPRGVALGDVNGDGRLDIVTANDGGGTTGNTASVLLGLAGGGFGAKTDYTTGAEPVGVALGDVTGDGRLDIVIANFGGSSLSVLPGLATGGIGPKTDYPTAPGPYHVALGDVNGDGRLDAATANYGRNVADGTTSSVLLGLAGGGFGPKTDYTTGQGPLTVTLGDVNGDGRLDLATANNGSDNGNTASVLLGLAGGGFGPKTDYTIVKAPRALVLGDVNGDGRLDIVTANSSNSTSVLLNTSNFAVAPILTSLNPTSGLAGTSVTLMGNFLVGATGVNFNGTAATFVANANGTLTATVPTGATSGNVTVITPGGVSNGVLFTVLTAAPTLTSPANNGTTSGAPTFAGTAPAGSNIMLYLTPAGGTTQLLATLTATGGTFSYTPTTALASGSYSAYATAQSNGATVSANSNTNTFTVDATPPTATLTTTAGSATSTSPIPFSVSFSEPVTGFSASGIAVTNGTVTGTTGSGSGPYTFSVTPTGNGTVTVSIRANAAQDATGNGNTASAAVSVTYTAPITVTVWTGTISPDWFTAGNWTAGVPTATLDATIPNGTIFSPIITSDPATTRNLTLNSGATLTMSGGTLDVRANLTSNGTFMPTGGTVVLGTTALSNGPNILGSSRPRFWNLTINANGLLLSTSAGASVRRLLTLSGALVTQNNPFVLESDASGTAMVVNFNSSGFVFGSATVQRYIDASGNTGTSGYRHYSSPVGNATVSSLNTLAYGGNFTVQANPAYNTANPNQLTLATYPNVFSYDESKIASSPAVSFSDFDKGYQSPQSTGDPLTVGRGYAVQIANTEKVQFAGPLNNGSQNINGLTYAAASTNGAASAGWALVGNPYPAPLDWRTVGTATGSSLNGVDGAAYVFQSTSAYSGRYTSFTNNVGAGTGLIASGQGFFVHASTPGTTGSITLSNANRVTSYANPAFQRTMAETRPLLRLSLGLGNQPATVATAQDETFVYFETGATAGYDGRYDAYKLPNPSGYYLGSVTPDPTPMGLSIDGRPLLTTTTEIPLWVSLPAGTYTLTATELLNFATLAGGTTVQLRDAQVGTLTDLATTPTYSFSVVANAAYSGRFSLVFRPNSLLAARPVAELAQARASLYPNPTTSATTLSITDLPFAVTGLQVEVLDVLGRAVAHYTLPVRAGRGSLLLPTDQLASPLYLLRLTALDAQGQGQGTLPTQRLTLSR